MEEERNCASCQAGPGVNSVPPHSFGVPGEAPQAADVGILTQRSSQCKAGPKISVEF